MRVTLPPFKNTYRKILFLLLPIHIYQPFFTRQRPFNLAAFKLLRDTDSQVPEVRSKSLQLTQVEVTFVALELIHSATVQQLEAVEGAILQSARANPPLQQLRAGDAGAGAGRQGGRLGSFMKTSHERRQLS